MHGNGRRIQAALAYHAHLGIKLHMHDRQLLVVALEGNLHAHLTGIAGQLLAYTRHIGERVHTLEGGAAVDQLARIDMRWNRPIQHKRAIIGTPPRLSKEISHKPL